MAHEQINLVTVAENVDGNKKEPELYYQCREVLYKRYEPSCLQLCSNKIIQGLEATFYRWLLCKNNNFWALCNIVVTLYE